MLYYISVNDWTAFRYVIIGLYVGTAVVMGFVWWFLYYDLGPMLQWSDLTAFETCNEVPQKGYSCRIFKAGPDGELKYPSTIALSILVTIEMLNALNSLSETESLLSVPPWSNRWLVMAIMLSFSLHCLILYVPTLADIFGVAPLSLQEWKAVFAFSVPVLIIDEIVKWIMRNTSIPNSFLGLRKTYKPVQSPRGRSFEGVKHV